MSVVLVAVGAVVLVVALVDVVWTTIAAGSGAGPVTGRLARRGWALALAAHDRRPSHRLLSGAGVAITLAVLLTWIVAILTGWSLIFSATPGAVRAASTGAAGDLVDRLYFVGYTVFTLGLGDYVPGDGTWQLAAALAAGSGLVIITLSITYLVPVASAVVQRRQLAGQLSSFGRSAEDIVRHGWTGQDFDALVTQLSNVLPQLHLLRLQHLTYPVLHYFHSQTRHDATAVGLVNLDLAVGVLRHGVAEGSRPHPLVLDALASAVGEFLGTMRGVHISDEAEPVPPADLDAIEAAGIPVDRAAYDEHVRSATQRRRLLASYLHDDGWDVDALSPDDQLAG